jgi:uncharacterized delta-60 repeat protein
MLITGMGTDMKNGIFIVLVLALAGCGSGNENPVAPQNGNGVSATLSVIEGQTYDFGALPIDSKVEKVFTIVNSGSQAATQISGNFTTSAFTFRGGTYPGIGGTCSSYLAPGGSCTVAVTFSPPYFQSFQETLRVLYNNGSTVVATQNPVMSGRGIGGISGQADTTLALSGKLGLGQGTESGTVVVARPDRSIYVAGTSSSTGQSDFLVAHYLFDGSLDTAFGNNGIVNLDFSGTDDSPYAMVILSDGRIVLAGETFISGVRQMSVARLLRNGALDTTFNGNGKLALPVGDSDSGARSITADFNGNLLIAGYAYVGTVRSVAVAHLLVTGLPDSNFGSAGTGWETAAVGAGDAFVSSILTNSAGEIFLAGYANNGANNDFSITKFTALGVLASTFGTGGTAFFDIGSGTDDRAYAAQLTPNGQFLLAGSSNNGTVTNLTLLRLMPDFSPDGNFGTSGRVVIPFGSDSTAASVRADSTGQVYVAGSVTVAAGDSEIAAVKLTSNGSLDPNFGTNGKSIVTYGTGLDQGVGLAIADNGKVLIVGEATIGASGSYLALVRLWP